MYTYIFPIAFVPVSNIAIFHSTTEHALERILLCSQSALSLTCIAEKLFLFLDRGPRCDIRQTVGLALNTVVQVFTAVDYYQHMKANLYSLFLALLSTNQVQDLGSEEQLRDAKVFIVKV